jgi:competence ComEA-like helix-hairpin-helix protein
VRHYQSRSATPAVLFAEAAGNDLDSLARPVTAEAGRDTTAERNDAPADSAAIPTSGFADAPPRTRRSSAREPIRMNLNTADAVLLDRLPRIGPALAGRIIAYRQAHGPFRRVEEVVNVRGIGEKTLEQIAPYLYVDDDG